MKIKVDLDNIGIDIITIGKPIEHCIGNRTDSGVITGYRINKLHRAIIFYSDGNVEGLIFVDSILESYYIGDVLHVETQNDIESWK